MTSQPGNDPTSTSVGATRFGGPLLRAMALGGAVFIAGRAGMLFTVDGEIASPVWPATGVTVAGLTLLGVRFWPAVLVAMLAVKLSTGLAPGQALVVGLGNTAEAVAGALMLLRFRRPIWKLAPAVAGVVGLLTAAVLAPIASAGVGIGSLLLRGALAPEAGPEALFHWWLANGLGVLIVSPVILHWQDTWEWLRRMTAARRVRGLGVAGIALAAALPLLVLPSWSSAWFGLHLILVVVMILLGANAVRWFVIALAAFWVIRIGLLGKTPGEDPRPALVLVQLCVGSMGLLAQGLTLFQPGRRMLLPAIVLLAGWFAGGVLLRGIREDVRAETSRLRQQDVAEAEARIRQRMEDYGQALRSGAALFHATGTPTREQWRKFAGALDLSGRYAGLAGIGVTFPVPAAELPGFLARMRREDAADFAVRPVAGHAHGDVLHVVSYLEPEGLNRAAIGLDTASEPTRRRAAELARDTGELAITGSVALAQSSPALPGFILFFPVYAEGRVPDTEAERRAALVAWVQAPFHLGNFLEGVAAHQGGLVLRVSDAADPTAKQLFSSAKGGDRSPGQQVQNRVRLGGREFLLTWTWNEDSEQAADSHLLWLAGVVALATMVLAGLAMALQTGRNQAQVIEALRRLEVESLRDENARLAAIARSSANLVIITDAESRIEWVNPGFERVTGYTLADVVGRRPTDFLQGPQTDAATKAFMRSRVQAGEGFNVELVNYTRSGRPYSVQIECQPQRNADGVLIGFTAIQVETTERNRLLREIEEERERLRLLVASTPGIVWEADAETFRFTFVSEAAVQLLGYPVEAWYAAGFWPEHLHPDDREQAIAFCAAETAAGRAHEFDYRMRAADGRVVWLRDVVRVRRGADGKTTLTGVMVDITAMRQASELVQASEARYRTIFERAPDGMFLISAEPGEAGTILDVNRVACEMHGYTREELIALNLIRDVDTPESAAQAKDRIRELKEVGVAQFEVMHRRKDGSEFPVEVNAVAMVVDGRQRILAFDRDISDRRRAERELQASEERWRFALEGAGDGVWDWNLVTGEVHFSRQWKAMLGYEPHEVRDDISEWERLVHPEDRERVLAGVKDHAEGKTEQQTAEFRMRTKGGAWKWLLARGKIVARTATGEPLRMIGTHTDIDEQVRARETERQLRQHLDLALSAARLGVSYRNLATGEAFWNPRLREIVGLAPEAPLPGLDWLVRQAPADEQASARERLEALLARSGTFCERWRILRPDGRIVHLRIDGEVTRRADGRPTGGTAVVADISEEVESAERLRQARANIDAIFQSATEGLLLQAADERIIECNPAAERILGLSRAPLLGLTLLDQRWRFVGEDGSDFLPEQQPSILAARTGMPQRDVVLGVFRPDGLRVWVSVNAEPVKDPRGNVAHVIVSLADITARRESEQVLQQTNERLRRALEIGRMVWWEWNLKTGRIRIDPCGAPCILGYDIGQLAGETFDTWMEKIAPEDRAEVRRTLDAALAGETAEWICEYRWLGPDGNHRWIRDIGRFTLRDAAGRPLLMTGATQDIDPQRRDMERRRQLEVRLMRSQKMESLGQFAGGIVHDFNNLLMAITTSIQLVQMDPELRPDSAGALAVAKKGCDRSKDLLQRLLRFSRGNPGQAHREVNLAQVVRDTAPLIVAALPRRVSLQLELAAVPPLLGDDVQLMQLLFNLCVNGGHAIGEGRGTVQVGVRASRTGGQDGIELWVADDGRGMDAATKARIFEPFFSTKAAGEGTGLGLAVVYGIVRAHGGTIEVASEPGQGARFTVRLPVTGVPPEAPAAPPPAAPKALGPATILVVDDEPNIVDVLQLALQSAGHAVWATTQPREALERLALDPSKVDLVISDLTMPEVEGIELIALMRALRPGLPAVLISGNFGPRAAEAQRLPGVVLMTKPLELPDLTRAVQHLLARPPA